MGCSSVEGCVAVEGGVVAVVSVEGSDCVEGVGTRVAESSGDGVVAAEPLIGAETIWAATGDELASTVDGSLLDASLFGATFSVEASLARRMNFLRSSSSLRDASRSASRSLAAFS